MRLLLIAPGVVPNMVTVTLFPSQLNRQVKTQVRPVTARALKSILQLPDAPVAQVVGRALQVIATPSPGYPGGHVRRDGRV